MSTQDHRWLLPRHQTEYPTRDLIAEARIHARREGTFLVLATLALVAATTMVLLAANHVIDLSAAFGALDVDLDLPVAFALPVGMIPSALAVIAILLACELYGRRRAGALVWAGLFAVAASVGLGQVVELGGGTAAPIGVALAFAAYYVVGQVVALVMFASLRTLSRGRRFSLRVVFVSLVAQLAAGAAFAGTLHAATSLPIAQILGLALGSVACVLACVVALLVPAAIAAHALALFLRVSRFASGAVVEAVSIAEGSAPRGRRRAERAPLEPFSHAELRFFTEGEQLADN
jgi:uncharacterized PurR-regulated membrane protein YhhQ (DUF165 family)